MRKSHQEDVRNKGWYTSPPSLRPPDFLHKDVFDLILNGSELVARLVACGFTESSAWDICMKYATDGNYSGLEGYIHQQELLYDDRKQYV